MIVECQNCSRKFLVKDRDIPKEGRMVQCGYCSQRWFQTSIKINTPVKRKKTKKKIEKVEIDTIEKIIDPSSEEIDKRLPDVYKPKNGLGFFGYIFLLIIITLSIVGVLKTFQNELLMYFPEAEYIYDKGEYIFETMENMIIIVKDLVKSY